MVGYKVVRMVGIGMQCSRIVYFGVVVVSVMFLGIVGSSWLWMAWFDVWKGRLALRGIV